MIAEPVVNDDIGQLCYSLEQQELDSVTIPGEVYSKLLAVYLVQGELSYAKFLWKRIPDAVKVELAELGKIWEIGKKMWAKDRPAVYKLLAQDWSEALAPLMAKMVIAYREEAFELVSKAYTTIKIGDLGAYLGLEDNDAGGKAEAAGWTWDKKSGMVSPVQARADPTQQVPTEEQLSRLTDFICHLEN